MQELHDVQVNVCKIAELHTVGGQPNRTTWCCRSSTAAPVPIHASCARAPRRRIRYLAGADGVSEMLWAMTTTITGIAGITITLMTIAMVPTAVAPTDRIAVEAMGRTAGHP